MKNYNIFKNGNAVGTVNIEPEGLYARIMALCYPPDAQIYKLILLCDSERVDLGICVPEGNSFRVNKRILRSTIEGKKLQFILEEKEPSKCECFIPLDSQKPFDCLDSLLQARFAIRETVCGVVLEQK